MKVTKLTRVFYWPRGDSCGMLTPKGIYLVLRQRPSVMSMMQKLQGLAKDTGPRGQGPTVIIDDAEETEASWDAYCLRC